MAEITCSDYSIYINEDWSILRSFIGTKAYSKVGVIVDENTERDCLSILEKELELEDIEVIKIVSGEVNKNIETCQAIWSQMLDSGFDRHSLIINLGGGVIGDMGGFCASTFMRGIGFIQIPTTLLSQVDASVGGKLGIDFQDYKNIIGMIISPQMVWIHTPFLSTLDQREIRSGYAEIIKHALISNKEMWEEVKSITDLSEVNWAPIIERSVKIKKDIVEQDMYEGGVRKVLNFGHTIGHAVESHYLHADQPLLHGEAISIGMIIESYISMNTAGLSEAEYGEIKAYILSIYPHYRSYLEDEAGIMQHLIKDKKNRRGRINYSLLSQIGEAVFDMNTDEEEVISGIRAYANL